MILIDSKLVTPKDWILWSCLVHQQKYSLFHSAELDPKHMLSYVRYCISSKKQEHFLLSRPRLEWEGFLGSHPSHRALYVAFCCLGLWERVGLVRWEVRVAV